MNSDEVIAKYSHFYVSDNEKRDLLFVEHCMMQQWQWLRLEGVFYDFGFSAILSSWGKTGCF